MQRWEINSYGIKAGLNIGKRKCEKTLAKVK